MRKHLPAFGHSPADPSRSLLPDDEYLHVAGHAVDTDCMESHLTISRKVAVWRWPDEPGQHPQRYDDEPEKRASAGARHHIHSSPGR